MADIWSAGCSPTARTLYRTLFPLVVRPLMNVTMQINAVGAAAGCARTAEALDLVARESATTGYLVGDQFSMADLCAASVLQLAAPSAEYLAPFPEPRPPGVAAWLARWSGHPGAADVRRMYHLHRGKSHALANGGA